MAHEASAAAQPEPAPESARTSRSGPESARTVRSEPEAPPAGAGDPSAAHERTRLTRRQLLRRIGWSGLALLAAAFVPGSVRFLRPGGAGDGDALLDVGALADFRAPAVRTRWARRHGLWLVQQEGRLYALEARCTHLGCTPRWVEGEQVFHCPCHGSRFSPDGVALRGPATEPLLRLAIRAEGGRVVVNRSLRAKLDRAERDPRFFVAV
jgi:cytochrome b6-f complex iron-sulfur subunit